MFDECKGTSLLAQTFCVSLRKIYGYWQWVQNLHIEKILLTTSKVNKKTCSVNETVLHGAFSFMKDSLYFEIIVEEYLQYVN